MEEGGRDETKQNAAGQTVVTVLFQFLFAETAFSLLFGVFFLPA